ncbi:hypothetical protein [Cuneatibacter caecimuris]|uniref:Uncharacterized protein n=1 Tax=Cuneatibacter caecimuris TaxID=1796618 RepID=A0A4Q7PL97_9FIRM|nr:hypothetical protein [Cuneatibacter caecimuris]RZT00898.1 hypothetical protein EV209_1334 [Cuneatibacter caecimuris]
MIGLTINGDRISDRMIVERITIQPAQVKKNYINVPGADGRLDLTEALGVRVYDVRDINITIKRKIPKMTRWLELYCELLQAFDGKIVDIVLDADPEFLYRGRVTKVTPEKDGKIRGVTLGITADPYKYKLKRTVKTFEVSGRLETSLPNLFRPVVPEITTDAEMHITFSGQTIAISPGTMQIPEIMLEAGEHSIILSGTGTISFSYQEAAL